VVTQRYAVETVMGKLLSTRQPASGCQSTASRVERWNYSPIDSLHEGVHQMKTLRCCRADFADKTWTGPYMTLWLSEDAITRFYPHVTKHCQIAFE